MHLRRIVPFDHDGLVPIADKKAFEFLRGNPGENRGIGDFISVQVENRENRPVRDGIQKFVGMPGSGHGTGFGFSVPDDAHGNQIRVVEHRPVGV